LAHLVGPQMVFDLAFVIILTNFDMFLSLICLQHSILTTTKRKQCVTRCLNTPFRVCSVVLYYSPVRQASRSLVTGKGRMPLMTPFLHRGHT